MPAARSSAVASTATTRCSISTGSTSRSGRGRRSRASLRGGGATVMARADTVPPSPAAVSGDLSGGDNVNGQRPRHCDRLPSSRPAAGPIRSSASCIAVRRRLRERGLVSLRCLIVDDSEEFLASAARLLESQGIEVVGSATSGAEALELAAALEPDLALVDVELRDEDGVAIGNEIEARVPSTRIVLISAYERDEFPDLIGESRAVGFLPKRDLGAAAIAGLLGS